MTQTIVPALVVRRLYAAAPDAVFHAWTTPETMQRFLGPADSAVENVHVDLRPGGAYGFDMLVDGERWHVGGEYREVAAPHRLVMTWRWSEDDPADEIDTLLTLEFNPAGGGTELVLTHAQLASTASRDRHAGGWTMVLEKLATLPLA